MKKRKVVIDVQGALKIFVTTILLLLVFGGFSALTNMIPVQIKEGTQNQGLFIVFTFVLGFLSLLQYSKNSSYKNSSEFGEGTERGTVLFLTVLTVCVVLICFVLAVF